MGQLHDVTLARWVRVDDSHKGWMYRKAKMPCIAGMYVVIGTDCDPILIESFVWDDISGILYAFLDTVGIDDDDAATGPGWIDYGDDVGPDDAESQWHFETYGWELDPNSDDRMSERYFRHGRATRATKSRETWFQRTTQA